MIHKLAEITGGDGYFVPAPFFADSLEDKLVLLAQKGLRDVMELAGRADLYLVGIGEVGPEAHLLTHGMITPEEFRQLARAGAVGEVLGRFFDGPAGPSRPTSTSARSRSTWSGCAARTWSRSRVVRPSPPPSRRCSAPAASTA